MLIRQYPYFCPLIGDSGVAHDFAQEAFIRLHDRWETVSGYDQPGSWHRRVMSNLLIDYHRSDQPNGGQRCVTSTVASVDPRRWAISR